MAGLYIHIPFCSSRCIYCGFYSTTYNDLQDRYIDAVCRELELRKSYTSKGIGTIYLGGGTPSLLSSDNLHKIFNKINSVYGGISASEITMECNPDDVTPEFCEMLSSLPINRVSMGAQTFSDRRLAFLHRRHKSEDVILATQRLRAAGINNISIDLMFGFPDETLEDWEEDIWMILALNPQHISAYSLMYEEATPLYNMLENGKIKEIDEELSLRMYNKLIDLLTAAGYEHYEISNFARPGFHSRHNSSYWNATPYIGIGAAAHSYNGLSRQWNISDIKEYISSLSQGNIPYEKEELDLHTRYDDLITTALRTKKGIDLEKMKGEYGDGLYNYLLENAKDKINKGLMQVTDGNLSLTRDGLFISDDIMSDLMYVTDSSCQ